MMIHTVDYISPRNQPMQLTLTYQLLLFSSMYY